MQAGLICGGWDPYEGGQVYEIPLGELNVIWSYFGSAILLMLDTYACDGHCSMIYMYGIGSCADSYCIGIVNTKK